MQRVVIILLFCFCAIFCNAQVLFQNDHKIEAIGKSFDYFIDTNNAYSFEQIKNSPQLFQRSKYNVPNFGLLKNSRMWIHIAVTNKSNEDALTLELAQPILNEVHFYYLQNGIYKVNSAGEDYPFNNRLIIDHNFLYELKIPHDSTIDYYLSIKTSKQMMLPIFIGSKNEIIKNNLGKTLLYGIFIGIIFVMFFYNLFIYFTVRDPIYLHYVLYILIVGIVQSTIEGYGFQFLWPNNNFFATKSFFVFTALVNLSGLEFVRKFLHTKDFLPKIDKVSYFLYAIYLLTIIFTFTGHYFIVYPILQAFAGIVSLYMLGISIYIARKGYRPAQFFVIAWIPLILGIIIYVLKDVSILPYNVFTNYSITIGSSLEVILLSFALADKINIFRQEKEASQAQAILAMEENDRIIREQNVILEGKVNERTFELKLSNDGLNKAMVELKDAQTQLVESEKMASLGQLTAGIAHEINNPINFVTSNVKPLYRDINVLFDAIIVMESLATDNGSLADKQKKIDDYKNEIDYDYLRMEIEQLLSGISEGAMRTAEIVKGLRIFSRLDEDALKKADINEGLDSTLVITNNLLNSVIKLEKNYSDLPLIDCYPGKLNQVFLNIMSNAIYAVKKKFKGEHGGVLNISTELVNDFVFIKIKDNGIGMDEATQKRIFEPFFTTKEVGEGTGLGMSIAYNTISKHDGQIMVKSEQGVGTEFIIKLPLIQK